MIGSRLTELLQQRGHRVRHLVRTITRSSVPSFIWNISTSYIDPLALDGVDAIVHLAGAGVADKRWTKKRKKEILESRTQSTELLCNELKNRKHQVQVFVCASAIGYYGIKCVGQPLNEESAPGTDFLAHVTQRWENEAEKIAMLAVRVIQIRTGIVLSKKGGALEQILRPIRFYAGASLGTGNQRMSWIHIDDHCGIIISALENDNWVGAYNSVAPNPVSNNEFTKAAARVVNKPLLIPRIPEFVMKIALGELASVVIAGCDISSAKVEAMGYKFKFPTLDQALRDAVIT